MAYFDQYGVEFSDDKKTLVRCPIDFHGEYIVPEGVECIGREAFEDCSGLTSIEIPNSVTNIGKCAFLRCSNLTSVTIPDSVISIGSGTFEGCNSLTSVTIGNKIRAIEEYTFAGCSSLTSVTIGNSVTSIGSSAFQGCSHLISMTIPNSVINIENNAFEGCRGLASVNIGNSVKNIGNGAFAGCSGLTSVTIPNSVTNIGEFAFIQCSGLTVVTIINGVTTIEMGAFYGCCGLTSVTIPNSVSYIGDSAFYGCSSLTSVKLESNAIVCNSYSCDFCLTSIFGSQIENVIIGEGVTSIGDGAFLGCNSLTSVTIPNSVTSIGDCAFCKCSSLTSISIPNSIKNIGCRAFVNCFCLMSVTIPDGVTNIGEEAFWDCTDLISVSIPESVTKIGERAFEGCNNLKEIFVPIGQEERFCEMEGLKDFADVISKTSEHDISSGERKRTWEECQQEWNDYMAFLKDSSDPLNKSILSCLENGLEPSIFPPVGICLTVEEYHSFLQEKRDIKEIYGWSESGMKIHDSVRLSTKLGQRIGPDTPRKGFYKVIMVDSDEVKCLYNYRRYTAFYNEIITIKRDPFYNSVSVGPKRTRLMVGDVIEVKDVQLVDYEYRGKQDKVYKVIWNFVESDSGYGGYVEDDYSLSYSQYGGYNDFDDDTINSAFEGDPEMTWNVD